MSRYTRDTSAGARAVFVPCLKCGETLRMAEATIDTEGPAFQAYYHPKCLPTSPGEAARGEEEEDA